MDIGQGGLGKSEHSMDLKVQSEPLLLVQRIAEHVADHAEFVFARGQGYHVLVDEAEMLPYFDSIRTNLQQGASGAILADAVKNGSLSSASTNHQIWRTLMQSQKFNGTDFEHTYKILPGGKDHPCCWGYNFEESIVLSHTLLLVPVMQHYGPLTPKLDLKGPTRKFEQAQPLLVVGMIGDCVKGAFFDDICKKASDGWEAATKQRDTLLHPERLQQKFRGLVRALLRARPADCSLHFDATLVGSGAFGGSAKILAQPFVDSLDDGLFFSSQDEVNFFIFPPPKPEDFSLAHKKYTVDLNPRRGLGAAPATHNTVRVVVAGFDPISLTPHGVNYRALSAEGQLSHATDMLQRLGNVKGQFVPVKIPTGSAWESPAAFFAKPQELKTKQEEGYDTVRFVPTVALQACNISMGEEVHLVAQENLPPRAWNGDTFEGWTLTLNETPTKSWRDVIEEINAVMGKLKRVGMHRDGMIPIAEFKTVFSKMGLDDAEILQLFEAAEASKGGMIDLNKFASWVFQ